MSTATAPRERTAMIDLVSANAGMRLILTSNEDRYDGMGRLSTPVKGRKVQFLRGKAQIPAEWRDDLEAHPEFGKSVFYAGQVRVPEVGLGPTVVTGQAHTPTRATEAPLAGWDDMPPRELRTRILANEVYDLEAATLWEFRHKGRAQVLAALAQAARGEVDADDVLPPAPSTSAPVIVPLPEGI